MFFKEAETIIGPNHHLRSPPQDEPLAFRLLSSLTLWSWFCFESSRSLDYLDLAIRLERALLDSCHPDHPRRWQCLDNLAEFRFVRFQLREGVEDLHRAITLRRESADLCPEEQPNRFELLHGLAVIISARFDLYGRANDLDQLIDARNAVLLCLRKSHFFYSRAVNNLANARYKRFELSRRSQDIDESIALYRDALEERPADHPDHAIILHNLAEVIMARFRHHGNTDDLDETIALYRSAMDRWSRGLSVHTATFVCLASALSARFEHRGKAEDLDESIALCRLGMDSHPDRLASLKVLATSLQARFEQSGNISNLDESIVLHRTALSLLPAEGCSDRHELQLNLAGLLKTRFERTGDMESLCECIERERAALTGLSGTCSRSCTVLNDLANSLQLRFKQSSNDDDLIESMSLRRAVLDLLPEGHPSRFASLANLASTLKIHFELYGSTGDLDESIALQRTALSLCPQDHSDRFAILNNLANSLLHRFRQCGSADDLAESILLHRSAVTLCPPESSLRSETLNSLAMSIMVRFDRDRSSNDLEESLALLRCALELRPEGHPSRHVTLGNLATVLANRFEHAGHFDDLTESIELYRAALALRPEGHHKRSESLVNLGSSLLLRFDAYKDINDINEAITLFRAALTLRPNGHPGRHGTLNNLAHSLLSRYELDKDVTTLRESIDLHRSALILRPEGHPEHPKTLLALANSLHAFYEVDGREEVFQECIDLLVRAATQPFSSMIMRSVAAQRWAELARLHDHHTTLAAYKMAADLLQCALTNTPTLSGRHELLVSENRYRRLAVDATSFAIQKGDLAQAVEFSEQGRGLLWSQMRGLRTPLDRLGEVDRELADEFENCSRQLEAPVTSSETPLGDSFVEDITRSEFQRSHPGDQRLERIARLSERQKRIIDNIRQLPGFGDFLRAPTFETLRQAASEGPVIIVNHSEFRCDAIIILSRGDEPCTCVPLDRDWYHDGLDLCKDIGARFRHKVHSLLYEESLQRVLRVLWERVVSKVVHKLKELGVYEGSRIWWCPTSFLSSLPFHAAGPYWDEFGRKKYLLDDYISSYTPTLTSLITARSGPRSGTEKLLFVGDSTLPGTKREREAIRKRLPIKKTLLDEKATRSSVINALRQAEWVHFACHGTLEKEKPFESAFVLHGSKLTLLDIAKANLPNAEFAFLSACHTAEQSPASAVDEALHLAAGMQFCGFRSVIGTMWQLLDRDGPLLTEYVYMRMMDRFGDGEVRFKKAAEAVRDAAVYLRSQKDWTDDGREIDIMTERWVNLVHIGA